MQTYTIGFTQKTASTFFSLLRQAETTSLVDVRLHNVSQLAGFAKRDDLAFFLKELCQASYHHIPDLAPTKELLTAYRKARITWESYEDSYLNLLAQRNIERIMQYQEFEKSCLLCSEHQPHHCHRRLVIDYLNGHWKTQLNVTHLV